MAGRRDPVRLFERIDVIDVLDGRRRSEREPVTLERRHDHRHVEHA
jgi:hypothetical protein